nr:M48 family metalloprotease [Paraburkholderia fynbosensis]
MVAVSRGALNYLTRDELQGVVAHEFSHILNGDMRLNIRLIGLIFGIMALSIIGRILLLSSGRRASNREDRRARIALVPRGSVLRSADHGGGVSAAGVPRRRQRRAVHTQPRGHCRGAQQDRRTGRGVAC